MTAYDRGDLVVLTVTFTVDDTPTDPDAVTASVRKPDGTTAAYTQPTITNPATGVYKLQFAGDQVGFWEYEFIGTGAAADVETGTFYVLPDPTVQNGRDLCRLADVAARIPGYTVGDDEEIDIVLAELITQESLDFADETRREIVAKNDALTRTFDVDWIVVEDRELGIGDAATVTAVVLKALDGTVIQTLASGSWIEDPRAGDRDDCEPITALQFPTLVTEPAMLSLGSVVEVTGTWGFPQVSPTVRRAVATFVVNRYLNDVAASGTKFAELANQEEFNMAASLRAAFETRERLRIPSVG